MKLINHQDPDIQIYKYEGNFGQYTLIGNILVFLFGVSFIIEHPRQDAKFYTIAGIVACVLAVVHLIYRQEIKINKRDGSIIKWHGLIFPINKRKYSIRDYDKIVIQRSLVRTKEDVYYYVWLQYPSGNNGFRFSTTVDYFEARKDSEMLSKFLGLPITDDSEGLEFKRNTDSVGKSILETVKYSKSAQKPPSLKSDIVIKEDRIIVITQPKGFSIEEKFKYSLLMILNVLFIVVYIVKGIEFLPIFLISLGLLILFNGLILRRLSANTRKRQRIEGTKDILIVNDGEITKKIKVKSINEIHCSGIDYKRAQIGTLHKLGLKEFMPGMIMKTKNEKLTFGHRIDDEEMKYIYSIIMKMFEEHQITGTEKSNK